MRQVNGKQQLGKGGNAVVDVGFALKWAELQSVQGGFELLFRLAAGIWAEFV